VIDRWKSVGAGNCNREDELDYDREDEESQLQDRLRNLIITPSDDGRMGLTTIEDEELHDDQAEHLTWEEHAEAWHR
jgi:hypothetical protein